MNEILLWNAFRTDKIPYQRRSKEKWTLKRIPNTVQNTVAPKLLHYSNLSPSLDSTITDLGLPKTLF